MPQAQEEGSEEILMPQSDLEKGARDSILGKIGSLFESKPKKKEPPKEVDTWKPPRRKVPYYDEPNRGMKPTPEKKEPPKRMKRSGKY